MDLDALPFKAEVEVVTWLVPYSSYQSAVVILAPLMVIVHAFNAKCCDGIIYGAAGIRG